MKRNADPETEIRENIRREFDRWNDIQKPRPVWRPGGADGRERNQLP